MLEASNISSTAFDGAAVWSTLPADVQARIGVFALELAVGLAISEHAPYPAERAGYEAARNAGILLQEVVLGEGGLPDRAWIDPVDTFYGSERFRIPAVLDGVCHTCGCSHDDPCEEGCGWHTSTQCTACAEASTSVPELAPSAIKAVRQGACRALATSEAAELPGISAEGWGSIATRIATMHLDEGPS